MKKLKKASHLIISFAIISLIIGCMMGAVSAIDERSSPCISSYAGALTETSSGMDVSFDITARGTMKTLGAAKIVIEKKSGDDWVAVKTFNSNKTDGMTKSNTAHHSGDVSYSGTKSGNTYRAKISFYAADDTKADSKLLTTDSIRIS